MIKRLIDIIVSLMVLLVFGPIILVFMLLVWMQDFASPFYVAARVGKKGQLFNMVKLRSMINNADKLGINSTSAQDARITKVGHIIRKYKLDELTQFWNVLIGDMSIVGPRPQVKPDVDKYTKEEMRLLWVKPGITDIASIVFSDEGDILKDSVDPDKDYDQLIRPWKSRLGLLYVDNSSVILDFKLTIFTALAIISKEKALIRVSKILESLDADPALIRVASRTEPLTPALPPGMD